MPRFSIVMPCYNAAATLPDTLDSLTGQLEADWELICVDDGSTDDTLSLIRQAAEHDPRIRPASNPRKGPSAARNHGALDLATAPIVAFCDADDLWAPHKLSRLAAAFETGNVDGVYARVGFFAVDLLQLQTTSTVAQGDLTIATLLGENPVCTMSNMAVCRAAFVATGGFDERIVHNEDLDWLIRLTGTGHRTIAVDDILTFYRLSRGGLSTDLAAMAAGRQAALRSAAAHGHAPSPRDEAIHARYLARRALRVGASGAEAFHLACAGLAHSPSGFVLPLRRGLPTLAGALIASAMPRALRRRLFA
jgi:glycosyltransferase involved in cell wall biosynthesis